MKWPESITLVRHDTSTFNQLKAIKEQDPFYQQFRQAYEQSPHHPETQQLARLVQAKYRLGISDHQTPLREASPSQAELMAEALKGLIELPDVVFVSPYRRTRQTLERMKQGWPELATVPTIVDERLRERERGLALLFNDWRVYYSLYPEQLELYQQEGPYYYRFPQGENIPDCRQRARDINSTWMREYSGKNVLAVTHHEFVLSARANYERWEAEDYLAVDHDEAQKPINCGVTIYRGNPALSTNGRLLLATYNAKLY